MAVTADAKTVGPRSGRFFYAMRLLAALLAGLLGACATLSPDYEQPVVTLAGFRALPSESLTPEFEATLNITNPNADALRVEGIVYTIALQGRELIKSVGKGFDPIEGYSQGTVTVRGSLSLLEGVRLFKDLLESGGDEMLDYEFKAKLDLDGLNPTLRISETGTLDLGAQR